MAKKPMKPSNPYKNEPENNIPRPKFSIMYYVVVIVLLIGVQLAFFWSGSTREIAYSDFRKYIAENKIESVKIAPEKIYIKLKPGAQNIATVKEQQKEGPGNLLPQSTSKQDEIVVNPVRDDTLIELLESKGIKYQGMASNTWISELIQWILPFALLIGIYFFVFRRMGGPGSQFMNIGKNKAALYENLDEHTRITFKDVAGLDEA